MPISEAARTDLYNALRDVLGPQNAETFMSGFPFYALDEVATKADLKVLEAELKADMAALRAEIYAELGSLRKTMFTQMVMIMVTVIGSMIGVGILT